MATATYNEASQDYNSAFRYDGTDFGGGVTPTATWGITRLLALAGTAHRVTAPDATTQRVTAPANAGHRFTVPAGTDHQLTSPSGASHRVTGG